MVRVLIVREAVVVVRMVMVMVRVVVIFSRGEEGRRKELALGQREDSCLVGVLESIFGSVYGKQCSSYCVQCTEENVHMQCTAYNVECAVYSTECTSTVYSVQYRVYKHSMQCTVQSEQAQYTVYSRE